MINLCKVCEEICQLISPKMCQYIFFRNKLTQSIAIHARVNIFSLRTLAPMWKPPFNESAEVSKGALKLIHYSESEGERRRFDMNHESVRMLSRGGSHKAQFGENL